MSVFGLGTSGIPWRLEQQAPAAQGGGLFEGAIGSVLGVVTEAAKIKALWKQAETGQTDVTKALPSVDQNRPTKKVGDDDAFEKYREALEDNWKMALGGLVLLVVGGVAFKKVID